MGREKGHLKSHLLGNKICCVTKSLQIHRRLLAEATALAQIVSVKDAYRVVLLHQLLFLCIQTDLREQELDVLYGKLNKLPRKDYQM